MTNSSPRPVIPEDIHREKEEFHHEEEVYRPVPGDDSGSDPFARGPLGQEHIYILDVTAGDRTIHYDTLSEGRPRRGPSTPG